LHQLNVAVDIVSPDSDLSGYRLVVAPLLHMLRPGVAKKVILPEGIFSSLLNGEEIEGQVEVAARDVVALLEGGQEKHEGI
jgi:hypothetical protein